MIDFDLDIQAEAQAIHFVWFLFAYIITFFSNRKLIFRDYAPSIKNPIGDFVLGVSVVVLSIAAYTRGDFYHYAAAVQSGYDEHLEDFYLWLIDVCQKNYLLWRITIWGTALLLILYTSNRLGLDKRYVFFVFFLSYIHIFNYARVSLACAVYYCGLSFIIKPGRSRIISYLIGIAMIWCCQFFHTSAYVLIALTLLVIVPFNRYTITVYILAVVLFMRLGYSFLLDQLFQIGSDELYAERFLMYANDDRSFAGGPAAWIARVLEFGSFYLPFVLITHTVFFSKQSIDSFIKLLYKVTFGVVIAATVFFFSSNTVVFFYRVLYMSIIPITFLLVYLYTSGKMSNRSFKLCVYWVMANILYTNLYGFYLKH